MDELLSVQSSLSKCVDFFTKELHSTVFKTLSLVGKSGGTHRNLTTVVASGGTWAAGAQVGRIFLDCITFCTLWTLYHVYVIINQK